MVELRTDNESSSVLMVKVRVFCVLFGPEKFKDYLVIGRLHRQPENWEGPDADTIYYVIKPLSGYSDKETLGRMLAGGGRKRNLLH